MLTPSAPSRICPTTRNAISTPAATKIAWFAMRLTCARVAPPVTDRKIGMLPIGSITAHSVTKFDSQSRSTPELYAIGAPKPASALLAQVCRQVANNPVNVAAARARIRQDQPRQRNRRLRLLKDGRRRARLFKVAALAQITGPYQNSQLGTELPGRGDDGRPLR